MLLQNFNILAATCASVAFGVMCGAAVADSARNAFIESPPSSWQVAQAQPAPPSAASPYRAPSTGPGVHTAPRSGSDAYRSPQFSGQATPDPNQAMAPPDNGSGRGPLVAPPAGSMMAPDPSTGSPYQAPSRNPPANVVTVPPATSPSQ